MPIIWKFQVGDIAPPEATHWRFIDPPSPSSLEGEKIMSEAKEEGMHEIFKAMVHPTSPRSNQSSGMPIFNEAKLGEEITRVWGMHGAHAEVFGMMLAERKELREQVKKLRKALWSITSGLDDHIKAKKVRCDSCEANVKEARAALKETE
jgi:hypothetical protein